jgi:hypothetical protein
VQIAPVTPVFASAGVAPTDQQSQRRGDPYSRGHVSEPPAPTSRFEPVAEDGNEIVYRAVDPETGAVLAQVPSEEVVRVAKKLESMRAEGKIR